MTDARVMHLFRAVSPSGPLHVAVSDGNLDDDTLAFCEREMGMRGATSDELELLGLLKQVSRSHREALWLLALHPTSKPSLKVVTQ